MKKGMVMALGFFDGVHEGHLQLIRKTVQLAEEMNAVPGVLTFEKHPLSRIDPKAVPLLLTDNQEKITLLKNAGIEQVLMAPFTDELMRLSPKAFIEDYLLKQFPVRYIVAGYNYSFGHKGMGTVRDLEKMGKTAGFGVSVIPPYLINNRKVCSTLIRNSIINGKVEDARLFLGRNYALSGKVIHGKQLGRSYNVPTANMEYDREKALPNSGVYYSKVRIGERQFDGLTNIGNNPTFKDHPFSIETYIYDFNEEIYDEMIEVFFLQKIREEKKFNSVDLLMDQIRGDIQRIDELRKNQRFSGESHEVQ